MRVNSSTPESVSTNIFAPELTLNIVVFHAFEALLCKPAPDTFISEIPDVLVLSEMMGAENVSGISENRDRHEHVFTGLLYRQLRLVDVFKYIPHRQCSPLIGVEICECAPLIQPGNTSRINVIPKRSRSGRDELTGTDTNVENRAVKMALHQLNTGLR